ncbi:MAG: response regulator [Pseudomonadota bacterium]
MIRSGKLANLVVCLILLVQTIVFGATAVYNYWISKQTLYQKLEENIDTIAQRLSNSLPLLLWNYNTDAINRALETEVSSQDIDAIAIEVDGVNEYQVAQSHSEKRSSYFLSDQQKTVMASLQGRQINYTGDDGNGLVGTLYILPSDAEVKAALKKLANQLLLQSLTLNVSLAMIMFWILYTLIIKPINKTNQNLKSIINEGADLSKRLDENNVGEIGQLAKNYNQLAQYLSAMLQDRQIALEKAEESAKLKSEFLASMSHEIRTPMNGVLGMLDLISKGDLNDKQLHHAKLAKSSAESLLVIINDILDFSKIEAGKLEIEKVDFDIRLLVESCIQSMALRAHQKNLELLLDLTTLEMPYVIGDPNRIRQILINIIANAIKFTEQGTISVSAKMLGQNSSQIIFNCDITDTGIGIPESKQAILFDAFSQVDASTTREYGGTGLGLAIVNQLCMLMDGQVSLVSQVGKGTCFSIKIKLQKSDKITNSVLPNDLSYKVLVIDESEKNRQILIGQLTHLGITTLDVQHHSQAIKIIETTTDIHCVLISSTLPAFTDLINYLREHRAQVKRAVITPVNTDIKKDAFDFHGFKPMITEDWVRFIKVLKTEPAVPDPSEQTRQSEPIDNKTHILLVEDNMINQQVALANLEALGFEVDIAENGKQAIQKLYDDQDHYYQLILMDCQMPEMDGYQATQMIRKNEADAQTEQGTCPHIPIIAMTANAMKGDREKCIAAGMDDYLSKPIDPEKFQAKLSKWLKGIPKN